MIQQIWVNSDEVQLRSEVSNSGSEETTMGAAREQSGSLVRSLTTVK